MNGASGIDDERAALARELAGLTGTEPAAAERAIVLLHQRHPVGRRNLVSVLATVAQLNAFAGRNAGRTAAGLSDADAKRRADAA